MFEFITLFSPNPSQCMNFSGWDCVTLAPPCGNIHTAVSGGTNLLSCFRRNTHALSGLNWAQPHLRRRLCSLSRCLDWEQIAFDPSDHHQSAFNSQSQLQTDSNTSHGDQTALQLANCYPIGAQKHALDRYLPCCICSFSVSTGEKTRLEDFWHPSVRLEMIWIWK